MGGRASYLAIGVAAILVVVIIAFLVMHQSGQLGLNKAGVEKRLAKAGFFIDHMDPTGPVEPASVVTTRAYYPTTANGFIVMHTLKYQGRQLTSDIRLSLKPSAPVIAKFYYQFDGKPIVTQVIDPNAPETMIDHARKEFEKIVLEFTK